MRSSEFAGIQCFCRGDEFFNVSMSVSDNFSFGVIGVIICFRLEIVDSVGSFNRISRGLGMIVTSPDVCLRQAAFHQTVVGIGLQRLKWLEGLPLNTEVF